MFLFFNDIAFIQQLQLKQRNLLFSKVKLRMGNTDGKERSIFEDWIKLQTLNEVDILKNKQTNELAQKRIVSIDPHFDIDDQLQVYQLRQDNNDSLVRTFAVRQIQNNNSTNGICTGHNKLQVLTQKITYRLCDLPQLTFPQSLLFLRQSLRAYSKVFKSYGPTHITKKMIGINEYGEVRCWLNQNWALNHPDHQFPTLQSTKMQVSSEKDSEQYLERSEFSHGRYRDQTEMVHNIVCLIEQKCEQGGFPVAFHEQIERYSTSFRKLTLYLQDFLTINKIFVPPKISYDTIFISKMKMKKDKQLMQRSQGLVKSGEGLESKNMNYSSQNTNYGLGQSNSIQSVRHISDSHQQKLQQPLQRNYPISQSIGNRIEIKPFLPPKPNQPLIHYLPQPNFPTVTTITGYQTIPPTSQKPTIIHNNNESQDSNSWMRPLSISKPAQNHNSFSSSYYQYSVTNPSLMNSYNNNQENLGANQKPVSIKHSAIGNSVSYQPIDRVITFNPVSSTATNIHENNNLETKHTQSLYQHYNTLESNNLKNSEKSVFFIFDGRQEINTNVKSSDLKHFSNFSTTQTHWVPTNSENQPEIQGRYLDQFNRIIGNTLFKSNSSPSETVWNPQNQLFMPNSGQQLNYTTKNVSSSVQPHV